MLVLTGSENVSVLVNLENVMCACTSELLSLPAEEEEETFLCLFYVSPVCRCC